MAGTGTDEGLTLALKPGSAPGATSRAEDGLTPSQLRHHRVFVLLAGFFVGNALLAELIGGKLFQVTLPWLPESFWLKTITLSCGVVLWPVVFVMTDIINEYF